LGVRLSPSSSKEALGRAQKLAPYLEVYKNRRVNVDDLQKELKNVSVINFVIVVYCIHCEKKWENNRVIMKFAQC
jgi:hypothetical protein